MKPIKKQKRLGWMWLVPLSVASVFVFASYLAGAGQWGQILSDFASFVIHHPFEMLIGTGVSMIVAIIIGLIAFAIVGDGDISAIFNK